MAVPDAQFGAPDPAFPPEKSSNSAGAIADPGRGAVAQAGAVGWSATPGGVGFVTVVIDGGDIEATVEIIQAGQTCLRFLGPAGRRILICPAP